MRTRPDVRERHLRQRQATHRRLVDAARELLEERPWSQISIAEIADRAGVTRTAFYKHFSDQEALLLVLLDDFAQHLEEIPTGWRVSEGDDPEQVLRQAVAGLVDTFHAHGRLLRALADEATRDQEVSRRYFELGARLSSAVADRIAHDVAAGRSTLEDPEEVATALIWMNERFLQQRFGQRPLGDPQRSAEAISEIWIRTVYGD